MEKALNVKYVQINSVPHGSTGGIMMGKHREMLADGAESYVFWGRGRRAENERECRFGSDAGFYLDVARTRLDGKAGFHSKAATKRLLRRLDEIDPDVVHLHNVHGYYVNIEMLFGWLASRNQKMYWTLHDCWAFTGHCAYFTHAGCRQWQTHCAAERPCPQLGTYPKTYAKSSCAWNYDRKRELFATLDDLTIVTPSQWLADLVGQSFLSGYPIEVRRNSIDTSVFKPTPSDFRERFGIGDRFMILGVASPWTERKGLQDFVRLACGLDSSECAVVLVGLKRRQIEGVPRQIIALPKTASKEELAEVYSAADVFFNPTLEDNYPTVNLEAEACGTPVVTYDVGGCRETLHMAQSCVVPVGDADAAFSVMGRLMLCDESRNRVR